MTQEGQIRVLKNALDAILSEAMEPMIKVYAQSALDVTIQEVEPLPQNSHCDKHSWFGLTNELCPLCNDSAQHSMWEDALSEAGIDWQGYEIEVLVKYYKITKR